MAETLDKASGAMVFRLFANEKAAEGPVGKTALNDAGDEGHSTHLKSAHIIDVEVGELVENKLGDKACAFCVECRSLHIEVKRTTGAGGERHFRIAQQRPFRDDLKKICSCFGVGDGVWGVGCGH